MERCGWQGGPDEHCPHHPQQQDPQPAQGLLQQPRCRRRSQVPHLHLHPAFRNQYFLPLLRRIRVSLTRIRIQLFTWCGSIRIRPSLKWCLSPTIFHRPQRLCCEPSTAPCVSLHGSILSLHILRLFTFIRIRIRLLTLMQIRIRFFDAGDPALASKIDADPSRSESAALPFLTDPNPKALNWDAV